MSSDAWIECAYPLQQVTVHLQGTRHSDRDSIIAQLKEVCARLEAGENVGELSDDDFGYRFRFIEESAGPSFFDAPASLK